MTDTKNKLSAFDQACADSWDSKLWQSSPEMTLTAFREWWDCRAREIGKEAANKEYTACSCHWKDYLNIMREHNAVGGKLCLSH